MKHLIKIFSFAKPYKLTIMLSLFFSLLFVIMNTASLWMISSLLSKILNPNKSEIPIGVSTGKSILIQYLDSLTEWLLGDGSNLDQLQSLCILMLLIFFIEVSLKVKALN